MEAPLNIIQITQMSFTINDMVYAFNRNLPFIIYLFTKDLLCCLETFFVGFALFLLDMSRLCKF